MLGIGRGDCGDLVVKLDGPVVVVRASEYCGGCSDGSPASGDS
jgi:hypothetical protein